MDVPAMIDAILTEQLPHHLKTTDFSLAAIPQEILEVSSLIMIDIPDELSSLVHILFLLVSCFNVVVISGIKTR